MSYHIFMSYPISNKSTKYPVSHLQESFKHLNRCFPIGSAYTRLLRQRSQVYILHVSPHGELKNGRQAEVTVQYLARNAYKYKSACC